MLTKAKKNCKSLETENFERRKKWIGNFPQNLAWINAAVAEKLRWMTEAHAMTVSLLTESSRTKHLKEEMELHSAVTLATVIFPSLYKS